METSSSDQLRSYSKPANECYLDILSRGILSDVTFIVGPSTERIPCHRVFLVAKSPVFEVMFSERWNEDNNKEIPLEEIDPKIFKKFLQFIYADTIVANVPEVLELLQVAHTYDVQLLVSRCEELLLANEVPVKDAVDVFQAAQKYEKIQLMDKAGDLMAKSLYELQSHPSFLRVNKETLVYILKRNCLKMKEVDLFWLAVKWAKNQSDTTMEQSLEHILPLIRFPTMTLEEFTRTVMPTGLLSQSTLLEVFKYFGTDAETKKSMASTLEFNTQRRRTTESIHYVDLYSGDLATKKTILLQNEKLEDCLQISTRVTGAIAKGISGISFYCPASREVSTASRAVSSSFKEFKIVLKAARRNITRGPSYKNLVSMSPVKAEEGKMTEIKFDTLVPLENNAHYRLTVEEIPLTSTQLALREGCYAAKVFGPIRNSYLTLNMTNNSVVVEGMRKNEVKRSLGDHYEHPQLIYRFGLEEIL